MIVAVAVVAASVVNGWLLAHDTDAAAPYVDSFVTWGSVVTTWMVARRVIENWLYWVVVDASLRGCTSAGLLATTLLFVIYLGIVVHGYFVWRREQAQQRLGRSRCVMQAEQRRTGASRGRRARTGGGAIRDIEPIKHGLTNRSWLVSTGSRSLRRAHQRCAPPLELQIDRNSEAVCCSRRARRHRSATSCDATRSAAFS